MYLTHHFSAFLTSVSASMTINEVFIVILTLVIYFRILIKSSLLPALVHMY